MQFGQLKISGIFPAQVLTMSKIIAICFAVVLGIGTTIYPLSSNPTSPDICPACMFKEFPLHGKVQVVTAFPDIKVQVVDVFPDLKVKQVEVFPDKCGEWQFVESFPDIKIQFVDAFPDIKIQYVDVFPGCP